MNKNGYLQIIELMKIVLLFIMGYVILKAFGVAI